MMMYPAHSSPPVRWTTCQTIVCNVHPVPFIFSITYWYRWQHKHTRPWMKVMLQIHKGRCMRITMVEASMPAAWAPWPQCRYVIPFCLRAWTWHCMHACTQALKIVTLGGSGSGSPSQLVSLAIGEASKLFDTRGGVSSGSKQDVVNGATMTMMKLVVQVHNASRVHVHSRLTPSCIHQRHHGWWQQQWIGLHYGHGGFSPCYLSNVYQATQNPQASKFL